MVSVMATTSASSISAARNSKRSVSVTYLLNLGRRRTSLSSAMVVADTSSRPRCVARSKAWRGTDLGKRTALTATPASITVRHSFAMQQLLQNVRGQAARGRVLTDFVHDRFEWPDRTGGQLAQAEAQKKLQ